jgi:hypothetical protein
MSRESLSARGLSPAAATTPDRKGAPRPPPARRARRGTLSNMATGTAPPPACAAAGNRPENQTNPRKRGNTRPWLLRQWLEMQAFAQDRRLGFQLIEPMLHYRRCRSAPRAAPLPAGDGPSDASTPSTRVRLPDDGEPNSSVLICLLIDGRADRVSVRSRHRAPARRIEIRPVAGNSVAVRLCKVLSSTVKIRGADKRSRDLVCAMLHLGSLGSSAR